VALGTEVCLKPGDIVLDRDPPSPKGTEQPPVGPCLLWPNSRMDQDMRLGMELGRRPGHAVLDGRSIPPKGGGTAAPNFWLMSIVAKRMDGSRCHLVQR